MDKIPLQYPSKLHVCSHFSVENRSQYHDIFIQFRGFLSKSGCFKKGAFYTKVSDKGNKKGKKAIKIDKNSTKTLLGYYLETLKRGFNSI